MRPITSTSRVAIGDMEAATGRTVLDTVGMVVVGTVTVTVITVAIRDSATDADMAVAGTPVATDMATVPMVVDMAVVRLAVTDVVTETMVAVTAGMATTVDSHSATVPIVPDIAPRSVTSNLV